MANANTTNTPNCWIIYTTTPKQCSKCSRSTRFWRKLGESNEIDNVFGIHKKKHGTKEGMATMKWVPEVRQRSPVHLWPCISTIQRRKRSSVWINLSRHNKNHRRATSQALLFVMENTKKTCFYTSTGVWNKYGRNAGNVSTHMLGEHSSGIMEGMVIRIVELNWVNSVLRGCLGIFLELSTVVSRLNNVWGIVCRS